MNFCPNCQTANPQNARFCTNCGFALAAIANCPNCGAAVIQGAKFCHNCGHALAVAAESDISGQLQKYIPRELLAKLQAAGSDRSMEGERRVVTMLFCDVKGSTAMAEQLDPEEWAEIMNGAFEYLIPPVYRYEGIIPRMMGDAVLAFFGAPIAHEDDPQRAVRAGLEMIEGIREYRERIWRERHLDFEVRVGINTGLVVVGGVGNDLRLEYTAMGDAINLAARMEQTAQPGTVQITEHTYRLIASLFEVEPLGGIAVKGKSEPVAAYRVIGLKSDPQRTSVFAGVDVPLVGRMQEMAQLRQRIEALRQGRGGIVCLIGESGLGKTRLIEELRREWQGSSAVDGAPGAWDMVSGASFAAGRPYGQFRQHMIEHMGILETDPPKVVREKIRRMYSGSLAVLCDQAISVYSRLLGLAGPDGEAQTLPAQGDAFQRELFDLVLSFERIWLNGQPGVQVFDNLHWTDPASAELMVHLLQLIEQAPILIICAFRPEPGAPVWKVRQAAQTRYSDRYTEIVLGPLTRQDSQTLVGHLFADAGPNQRLIANILEKAEGNPLFIEEVARELLERGVLERRPGGLEWKGEPDLAAVEIPDSLHALVMARLDLLAEDTRRTLQLAAIIGRSFYYEVLKRIMDVPIELDQELQTLQYSELIREMLRQPEREFEFRHALTQEAAYRSILIKRRRSYHRQVAEVMENLFSDRLDDQAELLAHHFDAAGDSRARQYYLMAGKKAAKIYARSAAIEAFTRALAVLGSFPVEETITIYEQRGQMQYTLGQFEAAQADFEAGLTAARDAGRTRDEVRIMSHLAWLGWSSGKGPEALALAKEAEARSLAIGDQALYASIIVGSAQQNLGDIAGARSHVSQALSASLRQGNQPMAALSLYYLAMQENFSGRFGRAAVNAHKACALHLRLGDRQMACGALFTQSLAEGGWGRYDSAIAALEQGRQLAEETQSLWLLRYPNQRAWLSAELGDWEKAYAFDLAGLHPAQTMPGFREVEISTQINLALDCITLGRLNEAQDFLAEAEKDLHRPEFQSHHWRWIIRVADARARLEMALGNFAGASKSIARLLDQAEQAEARKYLARGLELRSQAHLAEGAFHAAEADLRAALQAADGLCYLPIRIRARLCLARLSRQGSKAKQAEQLLAEASGLVAALDASIQHPELRASFERGIRKEIADS